MLAAWLDVGRGPLLQLLPFAVEVLKGWAEVDARADPDERPERAIESKALARALRDQWGLPLPATGVAALLLERAQQDGYLLASDGRLYLHRAKLDSVPSLCERKDQLLRSMNALVNDVRDYAAAIHELDWDRERAREALERLTEHFGVELALARSGRATLTPVRLDDPTLDVVHGFARHVIENDQVNFERLESMVRGWILVNALYVPAVESLHGPAAVLEVFLDAPLVLNVLGLANEPARDATGELLELLERLDARVAVHDHTVRETQGIVDRLVHHLRLQGTRRGAGSVPERDREALEAARRRGWELADLQSLSDRLAGALDELGIAVRESPPHVVEGHLDEQRLHDVVRETMGPPEWARRHDVESIAKVLRLRGGDAPPRDLSEAGYVFVTASSSLVRACERFAREQGLAGLPPVLHQSRLAALAWLRVPQRKTELPAKLLLAECWAGIDLSPEEWERCRHHMRRLRERGADAPDEIQATVRRFHADAAFERPPAATDSPAEPDPATAAVEVLERQVRDQGRQLVAMAERVLRSERSLRLERNRATRIEEDLSAALDCLGREADALRDGLASVKAQTTARAERSQRRRRVAALGAGLLSALGCAAIIVLLALDAVSGQAVWPLGATASAAMTMATMAVALGRRPRPGEALAAVTVVIGVFGAAWTAASTRDSDPPREPAPERAR